MSGAPDVITNRWQQPSKTAPSVDSTAALLRSSQTLQTIPVRGQAYQFSVPTFQQDMGWKSQDIPTVAGPTYPDAVTAPDVPYAQKPYSNLVLKASAPPVTRNRQAVQLTAPPIITTY